MGGHYRPVTCKEFKAVLRALGYESQPQKGTSHQHWVKGAGRGFRKVTVDCPKAPFSRNLLALMLSQMKMTKRAFYRHLDGL